MKGTAFIKFCMILLATCLRLENAANPGSMANERDFSSVPGHLEPLGLKNVKRSVEVLQHFPTTKEFFTKYVVASRPVLIQGGAKISPAFSKWTDEYFLSLAESSEYRIHVEQRKKEVRTIPDEEVSFTDFLKSYKEKDIYMVSTVPKFIQSDVLLPPPLLCKDITSTMLSDAVMWFSSGGTKSVLHHDVGLENINCLFSGVKELLFIDYHKYKHAVPIDFPAGAYSGVDVDRVDFEKYPGLTDVEYYNVTMYAGDCLYIPDRWYHQVRSYGRNIAVNLWWQSEPGFIPKDCDNVQQNQTIDNFNFTLDINDDIKRETVMDQLQSYLKKRDKISFKRFVKKLKKDPNLFFDGEDIEWTEELKTSVKTLFKIIDVDKDRFFSVADLNALEAADEDTVDALLNEYYRLIDLNEKQLEEDRATEDQKDDDEYIFGEDDYYIEPVKEDDKGKPKEEL